MKSELITVIVPVYNVEEYLPRCVDSVIGQTYKNLEIILVDDGATDSSGKICDRYASMDERIVVIHKENGGLSDARNAALDIAKGEYITCIDSDDYLVKDYVEYLYNLLTEHKAEISSCEWKKVYNETEQIQNQEDEIEVYSAFEALKSLAYQRRVNPSSCCKLFKRELFEGIRYPKGVYYEDFSIIYKLLDKCNKVVVGKYQKYYYFQRSNSIMNKNFDEKKMHRMQVANDLKAYVDERYSALSQATSTRCFIAGLQVFREIPYSRENAKYMEEAWKQIKAYRGTALRASEAKLSTRVMAFSTYLGKGILVLFGKLYSIVFLSK